MKTRLFAILFVGLLAAGVVCGQDEQADAPSYPVADTPAQALANVRQACAAGDRAGFLACFEMSADGIRMMSAAFDLGLAIVDFRERLAAKFGEEAVADFNLVTGDVFDEFTEMTQGEVTIAADGNTATCAPAEDGYGDTLDLVLTDGVWFAQVPDVPTDEEEIEKTLALVHKMTGVVYGMMDRVDDDGVTIEQIDQELNELLRAAMAEHGVYEAIEAAMAEEEAQEQEAEEQPPSPSK